MSGTMTQTKETQELPNVSANLEQLDVLDQLLKTRGSAVPNCFNRTVAKN
ncbi:hypothetical protein GCM10020331_050580 [Ectobacillus funiculus]